MNFTISRILFLTGSLFVFSASYSQVIRGRLTDARNDAVPFAAVYDEKTFNGTTSNAEGYYELKLDPGEHSIVFRALGYYLERRQVTLANQHIYLNIKLSMQVYELKEVVIKAGGEDPAYAIMRRAIGLAPYHLNQIREYIADVYLRGTIHVIHIPKILSKNIDIGSGDDVIKSGDIYLQESINQILFRAPDQYEQKVLSFHSTFPGENNDVNPMELINSSFYEPEIDAFISPLAPNAFSFYTYRYKGSFVENGNTVYKIEVIPKRNSQQLMRGTLCIVDKIWCLHSVEASVQMFFGDLNYQTIFAPVRINAWLPISYRFDVEAAILGIKLSFKYTSTLKYQEVTLNELSAIKPSKTADPILSQITPTENKAGVKKQKAQQALENLLSKEELTNRDMVKMARLMAAEVSGDTAKTGSLEIKEEGRTYVVTSEKDALKRDTAYWNTKRPIPLTALEAQITIRKDSTPVIKKDAVKVKDTTGAKKKKIVLGKAGNFITNGAGFNAFNKTLYIRYDGIIGLKKFDFNTVDGFIFRQTFSLDHKIDSAHRLKVYPGLAYAFSRQRIMWWTDIYYDYLPMREGNIHFHIGSESADYNSETGMNSTINSLASLLFRRNYLKLYRQNQVFAKNRIELVSGMNLYATAGYRTAQPLTNHSDYSFFYRGSRQYTTNIPIDDSITLKRNVYNEEAWWDIRLEYTPKYYYKVRDGRKDYQYSKYPTFFIRNRMALPGIVKSTADYDLLEAGAGQRIEWGMMHAFSWDLKGGVFLNHNRIYLMDDKYFSNYDLPFSLGKSDPTFRLAPMYGNAATHSFAEAHITFTTPYLLIKYLPFLSNKFWCENLHLNYLIVSGQHHYWEIGYSLSKIYFLGSISVFAGFRNFSHDSVGLQVSVEL